MLRDIAPDKELTAECTDDDFDRGNYNLNRYSPKDDSIISLHDNLIVQDSKYLDAGKGVFYSHLLEPELYNSTGGLKITGPP